MSRPAPGVLFVTTASYDGSNSIGDRRSSSASGLSVNVAPARAAACIAPASSSRERFKTNFRAVRLLKGPVLIQNSFVYRRISASTSRIDLFAVAKNRLEKIADVEVQRMPLVVVDVAAGKRGQVEMPDEDLVAQRQRCESVRINLHDRRIVNALEEILPTLAHSQYNTSRCPSRLR